MPQSPIPFRPLAIFWTTCLLCVSLMACATSRPPVASNKPTAEAAPREKIELESQKITATPDPALGTQIFGGEDLFFEGQRRYDQQDYEGALGLYRRVASEFPDTRYLAPALLMEARVLLELKRPAEAIPPYGAYLSRYPQGRQRTLAYSGLAEAHLALGQWSEAERAYQSLRELPALSSTWRDYADVGLARAQVEQGNLEPSEPVLKALAEKYPPSARDREGDVDVRELGAIARLFLGEVYRRRAELILLTETIDLTRTADQLTRKSQLVLDAHHQYYRTFSYSVPEYTSMAAYRMGYLYERFYGDLMAAPPPPGLDAEDQALYREMLDKELDSVVRQAYELYGQVLRHAERLDLKGEWVEACRQGIARLEERMELSRANASAKEKGVPNRR